MDLPEYPAPLPSRPRPLPQVTYCQACGAPLNDAADDLPNSPRIDSLEGFSIKGKTLSTRIICNRCHKARHDAQNLDALPAAHAYSWSNQWMHP